MNFRKDSLHLNQFRSSCLQIFYKIGVLRKKSAGAVVQGCSVKKGVLKNFAKFAEKHQYWSHILIKLQKRLHLEETPAQVSSCEFGKILKNIFF